MKVRDLDDNNFAVEITNEEKDVICFDFYADGRNCESIEVSPNGLFTILTEYFDELNK